MPSSRSSYDAGSRLRGRPRLWLALLVVLLLALIVGAVVLGLVDVAPAPQAVEKVVPGDRFTR